jgi:hypothetical protein
MKLKLVASTAIFLFLSNPAYAKDFQIGKVRKSLQTDVVCVSNLPNGKDTMVLVDRDSGQAWINIDGKDIRLKKISTQVINPNKRSISKYRDGIITVTLDSKITRTTKDELQVDYLLEKITFKVDKKSKTIQTTGYCSV